jgi:hypothetical protein
MVFLAMSTQSAWTEVVKPTTFTAGSAAFEEWLKANAVTREQLVDDDIRVDVIRTVDGDRVRYLVRTERLRELGLFPG